MTIKTWTPTDLTSLVKVWNALKVTPRLQEAEVLVKTIRHQIVEDFFKAHMCLEETLSVYPDSIFEDANHTKVAITKASFIYKNQEPLQIMTLVGAKEDFNNLNCTQTLNLLWVYLSYRAQSRVVQPGSYWQHTNGSTYKAVAVADQIYEVNPELEFVDAFCLEESSTGCCHLYICPNQLSYYYYVLYTIPADNSGPNPRVFYKGDSGNWARPLADFLALKDDCTLRFTEVSNPNTTQPTLAFAYAWAPTIESLIEGFNKLSPKDRAIVLDRIA